MEPVRRRAHLNLIDSSRQLFELDPGAKIEAADGWLFGAGSSPHPAISNAAFRADDELEPTEFLDRAQIFFGELGRGFSLWARGGAPEDEDLIAAAETGGLKQVHAMPEMLLSHRAKERPLSEGVELRQLDTDEQAEEYWRIAKSSYASNGFPPEVFRYEDGAGLRADNIAAFLAYLDGEAVGIAMTLVSHGVAGIFWVGTLESARGKGIGRAVAAAATNAGFDLGADVASLQASTMGEPIYRAMGYEKIYDYRLLMALPPERSS